MSKWPHKKIDDAERERLRLEHWSWIHMILVQTAFGSALGCLVGYLMLHYNIANLGTLMWSSKNWLGYTLLLMFGFASLIGPLAAGTAIWMRAEKEARDEQT